MKLSIKHRIEYAFVRTLIFALGRLPESLAYGGMSLLGEFIFLCSKRRQRYAMEFLRQAYPDGKSDRELFAIGRRSTGNFLKVTMDMVRVGRVLERGDIERYVEDVDVIHRLVPDGPAFMVSGHLGSWEIGAIIAGKVRGEAHGIARTFKNPLLQRYLYETRRSTGLHIHSRRGGIRGLARAMKRGATGLQLVDQNQRLRGVFVPFFGKLASSERAVATLAVRQGYPVVVCFCPRITKGFRFRFLIADVIHPDKGAGADVTQGVENLVRRMNSAMERVILEYPEQYLWIHDRYRTRPQGSVAPAVAGPAFETRPGTAALSSE